MLVRQLCSLNYFDSGCFGGVATSVVLPGMKICFGYSFSFSSKATFLLVLVLVLV